MINLIDTVCSNMLPYFLRDKLRQPAAVASVSTILPEIAAN